MFMLSFSVSFRARIKIAGKTLNPTETYSVAPSPVAKPAQEILRPRYPIVYDFIILFLFYVFFFYRARIKIAGKPLNPTETYSVALPRNLLKGAFKIGPLVEFAKAHKVCVFIYTYICL